MADCSAAGTALDRVIHSAVSSALQHPNNHHDISRHAVSAFGSFLGTTAATAGPPSLLLPSAPMETLPSSPPTTLANSSTERAASSSYPATLVAGPSTHHLSSHRLPLHLTPHPTAMMQQQYQMMQQMQMQQMHMAAMVEHQRAQQRMQARRNVESKQGASNTAVSLESDDVVTGGEAEMDDDTYDEGITHNASIERLARAWREAEEEFAAELDEGDYDLSNMGGVYDDIRTSHEAVDNAANHALEPHYEFSPLSQNYGCLPTPTTDLPPSQLSYPDNLYERGLQHFRSGEIATAVLCFESTLRNIDSEHADAWRMLGKCHTENDADSKAIACWLKSLERDPYSPETLLALVVAYVNELDWEKAVENLKLWVANHPLYAGMENGAFPEEEEDLYGSGQDETREGWEGGMPRMRRSTLVQMRDVERLLLRALKYNRDDDAAADVYEALGVVYNVSRDYDAAVDAFRKAIRVRPDDYQLRNKVGATLANSNRSEEALPEYRMALKLKPKYARGWLNMAISHSNLRNYSQAARCYLQTLSLNPEAAHVWSYLRIALTCDEKWDLLPLAAARNLSAFHEHFDFVEYSR